MPDSGSGGFTYLRSGADRESAAAEPESAPESAPPVAEGDTPDVAEDYPEGGTIPEVKEWVGDDLDRAQEAYDRENDRPGGPRKGVEDFLDDLLSPDE